ncbi:MAG: hypothetical protein ACTSUN_05430 [Promethearchaeota archaeon]
MPNCQYVIERNELLRDLFARSKDRKSFMSVMDLIFLISLYLTIFLFNIFPSGILILLVFSLFVVFQIGHFLAVFNVMCTIIKYSKKEFFTMILLRVIFLIYAFIIVYHLEKTLNPKNSKTYLPRFGL